MATTAKWKRKQGDLRDYLLAGVTGVLDITGATPEAHISFEGGTPVTLTGSVYTALATTNSLGRVTSWPIVRIDTGAAGGWLATAAQGSWDIEIMLRFPDGTELTWPSSGEGIVEIDEDIL